MKTELFVLLSHSLVNRENNDKSKAIWNVLLRTIKLTITGSFGEIRT